MRLTQRYPVAKMLEKSIQQALPQTTFESYEVQFRMLKQDDGIG